MKLEKIESKNNEKFKGWKKLLDSSGIKKQNQFLLFGDKILNEIPKSDTDRVAAILHSQEFSSDPWLKKFPQASHFALAKDLFNEIDVFGIHDSIAIVRCSDLKCSDLRQKPKGLELLVPMGDPSNLGALLRSAKAFSADKIVLLKEASSPFHPKSTRAASGLVYDLPLYSGPSIHQLTSEHLVCLDMKGQALSEFAWPKDCRLLVGEEGPGLPKDLRSSNTVSIPISRNTESLNAMVSASIAMFSYRSAHSS
jgi:TrmH family RNA methyltransferase